MAASIRRGDWLWTSSAAIARLPDLAAERAARQLDRTRDDRAMTTNKKKLLITESLSPQGWSLFNERGPYTSNRIPRQFPPESGGRTFRHCSRPTRRSTAWRWAPPVRRTGARRLAGHEGGGADRRRLRRRRCPGAEPPRRAADGGRHGEFAVGRGMRRVHDADLGQARGRAARHGQGRPLEHPARRVAVRPVRAKTLLIVGFGRIGSRTAKRCLAMENDRQSLRSLQVRGRDPRRRL
ncbi:hypothetical protein L7F22_023780 [Adiantum nelumboides]|nr:hypothetical protein [Adiantum nelumboides]